MRYSRFAFYCARRVLVCMLAPGLFVLGLLTLATTAHAVSFTADAVQLRDGVTTTAKLYWSGNRVRFEFIENGGPVVQIYDTDKNTVVWLNPQIKTYARKKLPKGFVLPSKLSVQKGKSDPCKIYVDAECTSLKSVDLDNRKTDKWLITLKRLDRELHLFQWIDKQYKIPVRQENPDGSLMTMRIQANQTFNNRKVDRLDMIMITAQGERMMASQWYDPQLDILVREEFSNGYIDEMQNIHVEAIDNSLFQVPEGYMKHAQNVNRNENRKAERDGSKHTPALNNQAFSWTETQN